MPERVLALGHGVSVSTDVVYSTVIGYRPIRLDLYRPNTPGPHPLVVYVHGGAWMIGNTRELGAFANLPVVLGDLAAKGYVVASVEYRLAGEAPFPAAPDDVRTAIRFLKAKAVRYGINPRSIALWGASAGAQIAGLLALNCGHPPTGDDKSNPGESDCPQAAVGWYGLYDFDNLQPSVPLKAVHAYLGCSGGTCDSAKVAAASAVNFVRTGAPAMLLIHGTEDKIVPMVQSQRLAEKLKALNAPVSLELLSGVSHGWIGANVEATRSASVRALDMTFRFFDAQLKKR